MPVDPEMKDLLRKCDCLEFLNLFSAVSKKSLLQYPFGQLKSKLKRLLPPTDAGRNALKRIVEALTDADSEPEEEQARIKTEMKEETVSEDDEQESPESPGANGADEDEITFIEQIPGDVSITDVVVKTEQPDELIIIGEEDERGDEPEVGQEKPSDPHTSAPPMQGKKRRQGLKRKSINPQIIILHPVESCMEKLREGHQQRVHVHVQLSLSRYSDAGFLKWNSLLKNYGEMITLMDCLNWTWSRADRNESQLNLFHILSHTPNLEELNIQNSCSGVCEYIPQPKRFTLRKLQRLRVCHDDDMNYQQALRQIIIAAPRLEKVEFEYKDEHLLRAFLATLKGMEEAHLGSVKVLSLKEMDNDSVALVGLELDMLAQIQAKNLEELFLGFSLWQDAKEPMEKMLRNFINLKSLTIQGCFITTDEKEPTITVDFPAMPHLEFLSMGKSYKFSSILESVRERPPKRRRSRLIIRTEEEDDELNSASPATRTNGAEEEVPIIGEFFSISLNIPHLPKLKEMLLGALFEIKDLHFSRFPSIEAFRVSSPWHLTVKFPSLESSRHKVYPRITQLQLPDNLEDHTFVEKVATHFPNVEHYWIYLPNVKVLRAFSKVMLGMSPLQLKELDLKVQFDFASSLDWAFIEKPSTSGPARSAMEFAKIQQLKSYEQWKEYAKVYHIDIPSVEELAHLENEEEFRGMGSLCQQLRDTLSLRIHHIPRTLRLPKGSRNWNDDGCEFSNVLIGFKSMEYPFSEEAWDLAPTNTTIKHFKLPTRAVTVHIPDPEAFYEVDTSDVGGPGKKDEPPPGPPPQVDPNQESIRALSSGSSDQSRSIVCPL